MPNGSLKEKELTEAWLVTTGSSYYGEFLGIFDFRLSADAMRLIVDQIYRLKYLSPAEQMAHVLENSRYMSEFAFLNDGSVFEDKIVCDGTPRIYARRVHNLALCRDETGKRYLTWHEKEIIREWDDEKKSWGDNIWWDKGLSLILP